MRDPTKSKRKTVLWFAKDWDYLLVRLHQAETDGKEYQIMLKDGSVDGKPPPLDDELLLDDGRVEMRVDSVGSDELRCTVLIGGPLSDHKGINRRGGGLTAPALTDKDRADIKLAAEMELDYRLEADNQRTFAKAYNGDAHFVVPHVVASAPKVMVTEWIEGVPLASIIRGGTTDERDLCGTRLFELTFGAPARTGMMHGDAHPGNFMLIGDKMGVIDFGAVAPLPGGMPRELGRILRYAVDKNYDKLLPTMDRATIIETSINGRGALIKVADMQQAKIGRAHV